MKYRFRLTALFVGLLATALASPALAQVSRVGPTFVVNRLSNGNTTPVRYTDVAWDPVHHVYVVIWGGFGEVLGRFVASDGTVLGTNPFVVTAPATGTDYKDGPRVAFSSAANAFMVVWRDNRGDPNQPTVWGRSFAYVDTSGVPQFLGPDFLVTAAHVHFADTPVIAYSTGSNEFIVVYNVGYDVRARRFDINGNLIGTETRVTTHGPNEYAWQANVTYNPNANEYLVAWKWYSDDLVAGTVQARRIQAGSGDMIGAGATDVDSLTGQDFAIPSVAFDPGSNHYLIAWYRFTGLFTIAGRLMNADLSPAGSRFTVTPTGTYVDLDVDFSSRIGSYFAVVSHHDLLDIFGARVSAAGVADPMVQVTVTAAAADTGVDYGHLASATDRDEWLVTNNIWWNKATAQRVTYSGTGITLSKETPVSGAVGQSSPVTMTWDTVPGATYEVCVDQTNNSSCNTSWQATSATTMAATLANGTYYWQVRAIVGGVPTEANAGGWWSFSVGPAPVSFSKTSPMTGTSGLSSPVALSWGAVTGATFEVCVDQTNNNSCDTSWQPTSAVSMASSLANGTYYWQVRAITGSGPVEANGGGWWTFTVGALPAIFNKLTPANGAGNVSSTATLTWGPLASSTYQVCIDTSSNDNCDTSWQPVSSNSMVTALSPGTYSWQVRGQVNGAWVLADNGSSWPFTVGSAPGPFAKAAVANGASGLGDTVSLVWSAVAGAGYRVCWDTTNNNSCDGAWWPNGGGTSRTLSGLAPGTYFWQVRAETGTGTTEADSGTWWSFTVGTAAPPPPPPPPPPAPPGSFGKVGPSDGLTGAGSTVTLQWQAVANAGFRVCWDTTNNNSCDGAWWPNGGGTSRTLTGLVPGTYWWQVRAEDNSGTTEADGGVWVSFTVGAPPPSTPPPPSSFAKAAPTDGLTGAGSTVTLQWTAVANAGFRVCWDTINNNSCDGAWWPNGGGTSRTLTGLAPGTYWWQVRAEDNNGTTEADGGVWVSFTVGAPPPPTPPPPSSFSFAKAAPTDGLTGAGSTVTLQWTAVANAGFRVCWDTINNNSCDGAWWPNGGGTSRTLTGLAPGTYWWQVRAEDNNGTTEADGGVWVSFTVGAPAPPPPPPPSSGGQAFGKSAPGSGSSSGSSSVTVQWAALADAGYSVCWDTTNNNSCDGVWWPNGGGTLRTLTGLAPGTYYWQVRAQTASGISEADSGAWWSFTVTASSALAKIAPASGSSGAGAVALAWSAVGDAGYWVCWDTINNNSCDGIWWPNGGGTSRQLTGLAPGTYYWQVRAQTAGGMVDADGGAWFSFTVTGLEATLAAALDASAGSTNPADILASWDDRSAGSAERSPMASESLVPAHRSRRAFTSGVAGP